MNPRETDRSSGTSDSGALPRGLWIAILRRIESTLLALGERQVKEHEHLQERLHERLQEGDVTLGRIEEALGAARPALLSAPATIDSLSLETRRLTHVTTKLGESLQVCQQTVSGLAALQVAVGNATHELDRGREALAEAAQGARRDDRALHQRIDTLPSEVERAVHDAIAETLPPILAALQQSPASPSAGQQTRRTLTSIGKAALAAGAIGLYLLGYCMGLASPSQTSARAEPQRTAVERPVMAPIVAAPVVKPPEPIIAPLVDVEPEPFAPAIPEPSDGTVIGIGLPPVVSGRCREHHEVPKLCFLQAYLSVCHTGAPVSVDGIMGKSTLDAMFRCPAVVERLGRRAPGAAAHAALQAFANATARHMTDDEVLDAFRAAADGLSPPPKGKP